MKEPELGFTTVAKVLRVIDGDTVDVEVSRVVRVRLQHPNDEGLDFNAPEKNTKEGQKALEYVKEKLTDKEVVIFFPAKTPEILLDNTSFNRVIGELWLNAKRFTAELLDAGLAKLSKRGHYTDGT